MTTPEWLPDWENASLYPKQSYARPRDWAWEFLRRNKQYQEIWCTILSRYAKASKWSIEDPITRDVISEALALPAPNKKAWRQILRTEFGIDRNSIPPSFSMANVYFTKEFVKVRGPFDSPQKVVVEPEEIAFILSLHEPLEPQLEAVTRSYINAKKILRIKRNRSTLYQTYLRVLDANQRGVTALKMAASIYPEMGAVSGGDSEKRIKDHLKAAKLLRDCNYKYIV